MAERGACFFAAQMSESAHGKLAKTRPLLAFVLQSALLVFFQPRARVSKRRFDFELEV